MKKRKKNTKASARKTPKPRKGRMLRQSSDYLELYKQITQLKGEKKSLIGKLGEAEDRIEDIEIHINLLTRLLTTLCVEKFGMRVGVLKRYIKRAEKDAIRDSQIIHLESLYKLPNPHDRRASPKDPKKNDPWDEIS